MSEEQRDDVLLAVGDAQAVQFHPDALGARCRHKVLHRDPLALLAVRTLDEVILIRQRDFTNNQSCDMKGKVLQLLFLRSAAALKVWMGGTITGIVYHPTWLRYFLLGWK